MTSGDLLTYPETTKQDIDNLILITVNYYQIVACQQHSIRILGQYSYPTYDFIIS